MVLPDDLDKLIHNHNFQLRDGSNELATLERCAVGKAHPQVRKNLGGGRIKFIYGTASRDITFRLHGYSGLYNYLDGKCSRNISTKEIPATTFTFRLRDSTTNGNTQDITINAVLHTFHINVDLSTEDYVVYDCQLTMET